VRVELVETGGVVEPLGAGGMAPDRGFGVRLEAAADLLGAAHVVRDRDEDREPAAEDALDQVEDGPRLRREKRVDEDRVVAGS
jgi:hypothetical protein